LPCASITRAPAGIGVAASPTAVIRSPITTTVASGTTARRSLSNSRAWVIARPAAGGRWASRAASLPARRGTTSRPGDTGRDLG